MFNFDKKTFLYMENTYDRCRIMYSKDFKIGLKVIGLCGGEVFTGRIVGLSDDELVIERDDGKPGSSALGNWLCSPGVFKDESGYTYGNIYYSNRKSGKPLRIFQNQDIVSFS